MTYIKGQSGNSKGKLPIDISGKRFGLLTVREYVGASKWLCDCDCGNEVSVDSRKLKSGNTKSCKCLRNTLLAKERTLGKGYANMKELYRTYQKSAKKRGYSFDIPIEDFENITSSNCYYCGVEPAQVKNHRECFGEYTYNGIDRVNNKKGYSVTNIVPCCKTCNSAKGVLTVEEFNEWIGRVYANTYC